MPIGLLRHDTTYSIIVDLKFFTGDIVFFNRGKSILEGLPLLHFRKKYDIWH
jgi:hypothetical protein